MARSCIAPGWEVNQEVHPQTEVVLLVPLTEMYFWIEAIHAGPWECLETR